MPVTNEHKWTYTVSIAYSILLTLIIQVKYNTTTVTRTIRWSVSEKQRKRVSLVKHEKDASLHRDVHPPP